MPLGIGPPRDTGAPAPRGPAEVTHDAREETFGRRPRHAIERVDADTDEPLDDVEGIRPRRVFERRVEGRAWVVFTLRATVDEMPYDPPDPGDARVKARTERLAHQPLDGVIERALGAHAVSGFGKHAFERRVNKSDSGEPSREGCVRRFGRAKTQVARREIAESDARERSGLSSKKRHALGYASFMRRAMARLPERCHFAIA